MIDFVKAMIDRYRAIDPNYGSQQHQLDFIARCEELQRRAPCLKDHSNDTPPEHRYSGKDACYSTEVRNEVYIWQRSQTVVR